MPDYQKMYHSLFNHVSDAITKLQQAQQKTEEMYMNSEETNLTTLRNNADVKEPIDRIDRKPAPPKKKPPSHDER